MITAYKGEAGISPGLAYMKGIYTVALLFTVPSAGPTLASKRSASTSGCTAPKSKRLKITLGGMSMVASRSTLDPRVASRSSSREQSATPSAEERTQTATSPRSVLEVASMSSPGTSDEPTAEPTAAKLPSQLPGVCIPNQPIKASIPTEPPRSAKEASEPATAPAELPQPKEEAARSSHRLGVPDGESRGEGEVLLESRENGDLAKPPDDGGRGPRRVEKEPRRQQEQWKGPGPSHRLRVEDHTGASETQADLSGGQADTCQPRLRIQYPLGLAAARQPAPPLPRNLRDQFHPPEATPRHANPQTQGRGAATAGHAPPPLQDSAPRPPWIRGGSHFGLKEEAPVVLGSGGGSMGPSGGGVPQGYGAQAPGGYGGLGGTQPLAYLHELQAGFAHGYSQADWQGGGSGCQLMPYFYPTDPGLAVSCDHPALALLLA